MGQQDFSAHGKQPMGMLNIDVLSWNVVRCYCNRSGDWRDMGLVSFCYLTTNVVWLVL
jgi:hypothetical protein